MLIMVNSLLDFSQKMVDGMYFFTNSQICFMRDLFGRR